MTEATTKAVHGLRVAANLLEHYGNFPFGEWASVQVSGSDVILYGEGAAAALIAAGGEVGPWYGPRDSRQRNVELKYDGVMLNGYQVKRASAANFVERDFDPDDTGLEVEASND